MPTTLDLRGLQNLIQNIESNATHIGTELATEMRDVSKRLCAKDTHVLEESLYVSSIRSSGYEEAMAEARRRFEAAKVAKKTPKGRLVDAHAEVLLYPEARPDKPTETYTVCGATYGLFQELGTARQSGTPFFLPSFQEAEISLPERSTVAIREAIRGIRA